MKKNDYACLILSYGPRFKKLGQLAYASFVKHNEDIDTFLVTESNLDNFKSKFYLEKVSIGVLKYILALELFQKFNYKKVIVLGSDTITCDRLDEFIEDNENDIISSLDYPYQLKTTRVFSPDAETHLNADVVCFNNPNALFDIITCSKFHEVYHEQGGLNEVVWKLNKYKNKIIDYPYDKTKVLYNVRSKGNIVVFDGSKPWNKYTNKFKVLNNKLYTNDNKQIKVFHFCEAFGFLGEEKFNQLINWWIFECFNEDTKQFFKNHCASSDFFEKRYQD